MGVTLSGRRGWWWEGGAWGPTGREEDRQRLGQGARQGGLRRGGCWPSLPEAWGAVLDLAWSPQGLQGSSLKARKEVATHSYQGRLWPAQISLEGYFLSGPLPPCSHISHTPLPSHNLLSHLFSHSATSYYTCSFMATSCHTHTSHAAVSVTPTLLIHPPVSLGPESPPPPLLWWIIFPEDGHHDLSHHTCSSCTVTLTFLPSSEWGPQPLPWQLGSPL